MGFTPIDDSEIATSAPSYPGFTPISDDDIAPSPTAERPSDFSVYADAAQSTLGDLLGSIWQGVKNTPTAVVDTVKSIPSGISNVAHLPGDLLQMGGDAAKLGYSTLTGGEFIPVGTQEGSKEVYDRLNRTFGGIASLGATTAGSIAGPPGMAAANTGLSELLQLVGAVPEKPAGEELNDFGQNLGTLSTLGAGGKVISGSLKAISEKLPETAANLDRNSLQTLRSDFGKNSDLRTIESADGGVQTYAKAAIDDLLKNKELGKSRDPQLLTKIVDDNLTKYAEQAGELVRKYDTSGKPPIEVEFPNAIKYLQEGKVPADLIEPYLNRLADFETAIAREGQGKLSFAQQQKIALGRSWDPADVTKSNFDRAIYTDLKNTIEKYVPEIKNVNEQLGKWEVVQPIVNRSLKASENASVLKKLRDAPYSTGGLGVTALTGLGLGGAPGLAVGTGIGLGLKALASPTGQALIARGLRNTGLVSGAASVGVSALSKALSRVVKNQSNPQTEKESALPNTKSSTLSQTATAMGLDRSKGSVDGSASFKPISANPANQDYSFMKTMFKGGASMDLIKAPVAEVEKVIDSDPFDAAVYQMESDRNPKAKNPTSSASGGFQLIKSVASKLGVKDVFDLGDNYQGFKKLKEENVARFGNNPELLYSAHYLGATLLDKVLNGEPLTATQESQVKALKNIYLPRFKRIYQEALKKTEVTEV